jgi:sarcosine oxidase
VLAACPVLRIDLDADRPTLVTDRYRIVADRLIVTAGAWTGKLLPALPIPLRPTLQKVFYFRPADPGTLSIGRLPVFIFHGAGPWNEFYGMPPHLGRGFKVARHGGPDVDPDAVDRTVGDEDRRVVRRFLASCLPGLADSPIEHEETCLYTMTHDSGFRIVGMAARPDVLVASPCSGHGFKFSCLIGRILADLSQTGQTPLAIDFWRGDGVG